MPKKEGADRADRSLPISDTLRPQDKRVVIKGVIGAGREALNNPGQYNAFFGISVGAQISDADLEIYMRWVLDNFRRTTFFIDDWEHRWGNMVLGNISMEEATKKALQRGEEWARRLRRALINTAKDKDNERSDRIIISRSGERHSFGSYPEILSNLTQAFKTDADFRKDIGDQMKGSIGGRIEAWKKRVSEKDYEEGMKLLPNYLLEEAAFTIELVEYLGYPIEIYTGPSISVVANLYDSDKIKYPELRRRLGLQQKYGHINAGIEKIIP